MVDIPSNAEEWAALDEADLLTVAIAQGMLETGKQAQLEAMRRVTAALLAFKESSDRASRSLIILTAVLVILTVSLIALTIVIPLTAN
jgi:hypothetical protein